MQFRQLLMNNCNCQRDCLLPHLTQASKQVAMILILRFLRILRFVLSAFCSEMCLHSCVQPECRGLKGASKHFSERLHPTPVVSPLCNLPCIYRECRENLQVSGARENLLCVVFQHHPVLTQPNTTIEVLPRYSSTTLCS